MMRIEVSENEMNRIELNEMNEYILQEEISILTNNNATFIR
jgi:hypothetical protein